LGVGSSQNQGVSAQGTKFEYIKVNDGQNATGLFEFCAKNTNVEWSLTKYGTNSNYIATSHLSGLEGGGVTLFRQLMMGGYPIREFMHSHPTNTGYAGPAGFEKGAQNDGDKKFAEYVEARMDRYPMLRNTVLKVYDVITNKYIKYNHEGIIK